MSAPRGRRSGAIAFLISVALVVTGSVSAPVVHAAGNGPSVHLIAGTDKVTLKRPPGRRAYLDIGAYVASIGGAFEIWASRPDYDTPVSVWQVVRSGDSITMYPLPSWVDNEWMGLSRFIHVVVTDADDKTRRRSLPLVLSRRGRARARERRRTRCRRPIRSSAAATRSRSAPSGASTADGHRASSATARTTRSKDPTATTRRRCLSTPTTRACSASAPTAPERGAWT